MPFRPLTLSTAAGPVQVQEWGEPHPDRASLVVLPALGVPIEFYRPLFELWSGRGRHLLGVQTRAVRAPVAELRRASFGWSSLVRDDLAAVLASEPLQQAPSTVLVGHSAGGFRVLLGAALGLGRVSAVVTIATGSVAVGRPGRLGRLQRQASVRAVRAIVATLGYWPGDRIGFGGRQPAAVMTDWAHEGRSGRFALAGDEFDYEAGLAALDLPVLMLTLAGDTWVPRASAAAIGSRLGRPAEVREIGTERPPADVEHTWWVRRDPGYVVAVVEDWLSTAHGWRTTRAS